MITKRTFIIAEAGVNHNGDINIAYKLCDAAKEAGVDAVKFQTWKTENAVSRNSLLAEYQEKNIGNKPQSQYEMLKQLELSYDDFGKLKKYCDSIDIQFLSSPDSIEDVLFLKNLGVSVQKIGSGDLTNIPFLLDLAKTHQHVILSTGMSSLSDVEVAYNLLLEHGAPQVDLLHCTTNYPCPYEEVNLKAMQTLKAAFQCKVGYSDHTMGIEVPIAAVAMGAEIIEKHFTLDKTMDGPDHKASLEPVELKQMVVSIRNIENALGNGVKQPNISERANMEVTWKRIIAKNPIKKGDLITSDNVRLLRHSTGLFAKHWNLVAGKPAKKDYEIDEPIEL